MRVRSHVQNWIGRSTRSLSSLAGFADASASSTHGNYRPFISLTSCFSWSISIIGAGLNCGGYDIVSVCVWFPARLCVLYPQCIVGFRLMLHCLFFMLADIEFLLLCKATVDEFHKHIKLVNMMSSFCLFCVVILFTLLFNLILKKNVLICL